MPPKKNRKKQASKPILIPIPAQSNANVNQAAADFAQDQAVDLRQFITVKKKAVTMLPQGNHYFNFSATAAIVDFKYEDPVTKEKKYWLAFTGFNFHGLNVAEFDQVPADEFVYKQIIATHQLADPYTLPQNPNPTAHDVVHCLAALYNEAARTIPGQRNIVIFKAITTQNPQQSFLVPTNAFFALSVREVATIKYQVSHLIIKDSLQYKSALKSIQWIAIEYCNIETALPFHAMQNEALVIIDHLKHGALHSIPPGVMFFTFSQQDDTTLILGDNFRKLVEKFIAELRAYVLLTLERTSLINPSNRTIVAKQIQKQYKQYLRNFNFYSVSSKEVDRFLIDTYEQITDNRVRFNNAYQYLLAEIAQLKVNDPKKAATLLKEVQTCHTLFATELAAFQEITAPKDMQNLFTLINAAIKEAEGKMHCKEIDPITEKKIRHYFRIKFVCNNQFLKLAKAIETIERIVTQHKALAMTLPQTEATAPVTEAIQPLAINDQPVVKPAKVKTRKQDPQLTLEKPVLADEDKKPVILYAKGLLTSKDSRVKTVENHSKYKYFMDEVALKNAFLSNDFLTKANNMRMKLVGAYGQGLKCIAEAELVVPCQLPGSTEPVYLPLVYELKPCGVHGSHRIGVVAMSADNDNTQKLLIGLIAMPDSWHKVANKKHLEESLKNKVYKISFAPLTVEERAVAIPREVERVAFGRK